MVNLILYAIPAFVILLILELVYNNKRNRYKYVLKDTATSLSMGIGNVLVGFIGGAIVAYFYFLFYEYRIFDLKNVWWVWILLFFAEDLSYYIFHRTSHEVRYFWASHIVHHSSQHYNLGTALRQTWTSSLSGTFIFYLWLPLIGFHPYWILTMGSISLIYQFWIHTEAINKLPRFIEYIFNTPSHHRVHHGRDPKYLDKNHAGILIIWDRMFGTFQMEEEHPTYGLVHQITTFNPIRVAFDEWINIIKDLSKSSSLKSGLMYVFGPPGYSEDGSRQTSKQLRQKQLSED